jgi:uncharacterized protein YggE
MIAAGQQPGQPQFKIDSTNRTLSVSASGAVEMEPDIAILHVGFETQPQDSKSAYTDGARISNAIVNAIKQAGVADSAIHSESQYLNRDFDNKQHRYRLTQTWTVRVSPERAAEILDIAVNAGANTSGEIDWTVKDEKALEQQALEKAATLARENAAVLAKGMDVKLGSLIYTSNEAVSTIRPMPMMARFSAGVAAAPPPPLAIEPHKVSRTATVYAVFAIE